MTARTYRWTMLGLTAALALIGGIMLALLGPVLGGERDAEPQHGQLSWQGQPGEPLFELPAFELIDQHGEPFGSRELEGRVWVVDFIFTECRGICPALWGQMSALQDRLDGWGPWESGQVNLVSITVDPANDTPERLRDYAQRYDADMDRWHFLTGQRQQIWSLIADGFRLPVEEAPENEEMPILHSERFVLVDEQGNVMDTYSVLQDGEMERLVNDLRGMFD